MNKKYLKLKDPTEKEFIKWLDTLSSYKKRKYQKAGLKECIYLPEFMTFWLSSKEEPPL
jgi:hypothetical protein